MTYQGLYEEFITDHICDYLDYERAVLNKYRIPALIGSHSLADRINYLNLLKANYSALKNVSVGSCKADILQSMRSRFDEEFSDFNKRVRELEERKIKEIMAIDLDKDSVIRAKQKEVEAREKEILDSLSDVRSKHAKLVSLKPELDNIFKMYGLSTTAVDLDLDELPVEELSELIDIGFLACKLTIGNSNLPSKAVSLLYLPISKKFEDKTTDLVFKISWFISLGLLATLGSPYFFGSIGLLYIIAMFGNIYRIKEKEELLSLAYSLTDQIDFDRYVDMDEEYIRLIEDLDSLSMQDLSLNKMQINEKYKELLKELEPFNPKYKLEKEELAYANALPEINQQLEDAETEIHKELSNLLLSYKGEIDQIEEEFARIRKETKFLGESISRSKTMSQLYRLGVAKVGDVVTSETLYEMPLENVVFTYKTEEERNAHINFVKILLCNALCNVREKYLRVTIFDYLNFGRDFAEFYDSSLASHIQLINKDFRKVFETDLEVSKKNLLTLGTKDIQEFNSHAESIGRVTLDYHIMVILSTDESLIENKLFKEFMTYSAKRGTIIWLINPDASTFKDESEIVKHREFCKGLSMSTTPGIINYSDVSIGHLEYPLVPYTYSQLLSVKTLNTLKGAIEMNNSDILDYETAYRQVVIPDDKIWTGDTTKGIDLNLGFVDGDPSKPGIVTLANGPVHGLGGGTTGAGKTAAIDMILASLFHKYGPETLEMVMIDFKNVEFKKYTGDYAIPHASVIAGTKDGEYAVSIFRHLVKQMDDRVKLFGYLQLQNIEQYNALMVKQGTPEKCLPRILFLIDEYQVMFREIDDRILEEIKKLITDLAALARFCGLHMYFISQSQDGTLPDAVKEQFTFRTALRVSSESTSKDLIGTGLAAKIKDKQGYMYSNEQAGADQASTKFWRLPYIGGDDIKTYMLKLREKCRVEGRLDRKAKFYDEDQLHYKYELLEQINMLRKDDAVEDFEDCILLGERTYFSTSRYVENFIITRQDNEHIMFSAFEQSSILNMVNTMVTNLRSKSKAKYVIHSADPDINTLLGIEDLVYSDNFKTFVEDKYSAEEMIDAISEMVDARKEKEDRDSLDPFYFLLIHWDKLEGMGRGDAYRLQDRFKEILQEAGSLNIHIVMFNKDSKYLNGVKGFFNHKIISYASDNESTVVLESAKANKLNSKGVITIYTYGSSERKFKLYQFEVRGKLKSRSIA